MNRTLRAAVLAALAILNGRCIFQGGSETETLSGRVATPEGTAVAGARLKAIPDDYDPSRPEPERILLGRTDSRGRFRIALPAGRNYNLIAAGGGNSWAAAEGLALGDTITLSLRPPKILKAVFFDMGIRDSGAIFLPGTDLLARGDASDTAVLDSVPSGLSHLIVQGAAGWQHDTAFSLSGRVVNLTADELGLIVHQEQGVDCIPQPGEDGFEYPLNALLAGPGIPAGAYEDTAGGWRLLFDGRSRSTFDGHFTNWISGDTAGTQLDAAWTYSPADSAMATGSTAADIRSERKFRDFDLRFSYRAGKKGVFYRMLTRGDLPWRSGAEYAMDDNVDVAPKASAGALFDMFAPDPAASQVYRPQATGRWNFVRIVAKGDSVEHWLNNVRVVAYRFWDARWQAALPGSKWSASADFAQNTPGCRCPIPEGYIGFQGVDGPGTLRIRNLRINADPASVWLGPVACPDAE